MLVYRFLLSFLSQLLIPSEIEMAAREGWDDAAWWANNFIRCRWASSSPVLHIFPGSHHVLRFSEFFTGLCRSWLYAILWQWRAEPHYPEARRRSAASSTNLPQPATVRVHVTSWQLAPLQILAMCHTDIVLDGEVYSFACCRFWQCAIWASPFHSPVFSDILD